MAQKNLLDYWFTTFKKRMINRLDSNDNVDWRRRGMVQRAVSVPECTSPIRRAPRKYTNMRGGKCRISDGVTRSKLLACSTDRAESAETVRNRCRNKWKSPESTKKRTDGDRHPFKLDDSPPSVIRSSDIQVSNIVSRDQLRESTPPSTNLLRGFVCARQSDYAPVTQRHERNRDHEH
jgi:hypothetical protein